MLPSRALTAGLIASQVAYSKLPEHRLIAATRGIVALLLGTSAVEAAEARGPGKGPALVAASGLIGFTTEIVGVRTGRPFGRYSYSAQLGPQVGEVPLAAGAAWGMLARPAWVVAGLLTRRPWARVLAASGALTAWDVFLDPRMVREGYWTWPGGGRYEGVPASNFAGWLGTGVLAFVPWALFDANDDPAETGDGALALYLWTWAGETFANAAIWRRPRVATAGAVAMGAFAAPALLARRRVRAPGPRRA